MSSKWYLQVPTHRVTPGQSSASSSHLWASVAGSTCATSSTSGAVVCPMGEYCSDVKCEKTHPAFWDEFILPTLKLNEHCLQKDLELAIKLQQELSLQDSLDCDLLTVEMLAKEESDRRAALAEIERSDAEFLQKTELYKTYRPPAQGVTTFPISPRIQPPCGAPPAPPPPSQPVVYKPRPVRYPKIAEF